MYAEQISVATIVLWNFAALIVNVIAFVVLYMKANKNVSLKAFFVVQLAMMIWLVGKIFKTVAPTVEIRWACIVFYYTGIILLAVSFLNFAYIYNKCKHLNKNIRYAIYAVGVLQLLIVTTNPYHHLFYSRYSFWEDDFGILFYVHLVLNYLAVIAGMVLCTQKFKKQIKDKTRLEKNIISFAILAPLIFNLIYITRTLESIFIMLNIPIFDITPIVYTWSLMIFVYATFKYEFFDLTPIMKHEITSRLNTPILITDVNNELLYSNKKLRSIFDDPINAIKLAAESKNNIIEYNNKFYRCDINEVSKMGNAKHIITFNDVTTYQMANNALISENKALEETNKKLEDKIQLLKQTSHIGARNYVSRELHDIMGHSLVVTMKLLEVSKIDYDKNKIKAMDSLNMAKQSVIDGFEEIKNIKEKDINSTFSSSVLEREIKSMLKNVDASGMKTNFYLKGRNNNIHEKVFDIIKKISAELVTNSLKHADAKNLLLSIVFNEDNVAISLMDNGRGVKDLVKGNGLNGIDGRLALVGGKARYSSAVGEGFNANIMIPI